MEQVEKKRISLRDLSLKQSFMLYMVVFTLIALFCSISIQAVFTNTEKNIIYRKIPNIPRAMGCIQRKENIMSILPGKPE